MIAAHDRAGTQTPRLTHAQYIRRLRLRLGVSQVDMAEMIGVTNLTVHRWEAGKAIPSPLAWKLVLKLERDTGANKKETSSGK